MPPPNGLMFVGARAKDAQKTSDDLINKFYNDEHLPALLFHDIQGSQADFALRYQNQSTSAKNPFLTLFPVEDAATVTSPQAGKMVEDTKQSKILGGDLFDSLDLDFRPYEKIQTFEGYQQEGKKGPSETIVCVAMEPGDDADFEDWYKKQHLDMLAMCKGYRRCTRWKRIDGQSPRFLALHEYSCKPEDLPTEQLKQVVQTEWSKKIVGEAKVFDRDVWKLIHVAGNKELKL